MLKYATMSSASCIDGLCKKKEMKKAKKNGGRGLLEKIYAK
jgi:hypothetical protein